MCVDVSHLVLESFRNADNQIVDDGFDCAESGDIFAGTMVEFDIDDVFAREGEADGKMRHVLDQLAFPIVSPRRSSIIG